MPGSAPEAISTTSVVEIIMPPIGSIIHNALCGHKELNFKASLHKLLFPKTFLISHKKNHQSIPISLFSLSPVFPSPNLINFSMIFFFVWNPNSIYLSYLIIYHIIPYIYLVIPWFTFLTILLNILVLAFF